MVQVKIFKHENDANDWLREHPEVPEESIRATIATSGSEHYRICIQYAVKSPSEEPET